MDHLWCSNPNILTLDYNLQVGCEISLWVTVSFVCVNLVRKVIVILSERSRIVLVLKSYWGIIMKELEGVKPVINM